uniref:Uncharacterized protein n=1 Tax=Anguilla anguilla TaxID=7936 RepID=A0A0E9VV27_ANGAN
MELQSAMIKDIALRQRKIKLCVMT